jgi:hypothetical protein
LILLIKNLAMPSTKSEESRNNKFTGITNASNL